MACDEGQGIVTRPWAFLLRESLEAYPFRGIFRQDRSNPGLQSATGCRTVLRADDRGGKNAALRAGGVGRPRISAEDEDGRSESFPSDRAWIVRVGGVPLTGVRFFDPVIPFFDPRVAVSDPWVTISDPRVAFLDPRVAILDPWVAFLDPRVTFFDPRVTFFDPRVTFFDPRVTFFDPRVAFLDPRVTFSDPRVAFFDPRVAFLDPRVLFFDLQVTLPESRVMFFGPGVRLRDPRVPCIARRENLPPAAVALGPAFHARLPEYTKRRAAPRRSPSPVQNPRKV